MNFDIIRENDVQEKEKENMKENIHEAEVNLIKIIDYSTKDVEFTTNYMLVNRRHWAVLYECSDKNINICAACGKLLDASARCDCDRELHCVEDSAVEEAIAISKRNPEVEIQKISTTIEFDLDTYNFTYFEK